MRTSPPRPLDLEERYPALAGFRRVATRLHPRPGDPAAGDSSVGGPLLWPADEPWPVCTDGGHGEKPWTTVAGVREERRLLGLRDVRRARGLDTAAVEADLAAARRLRRSNAGKAPAGPQPMIGIAQLFARDVPDLPFPESADVLQVLWCPYSHEPDEVLPSVRVVWRASETVRTPVADPSPDVVVGDDAFVPQCCVVHPEPVVEYPPTRTSGVELPAELADYDDHWSLAGGWKVGGWGDFCGFNAPEIPPCACGSGSLPLLTVSNGEWSVETREWRPIEDAEFTPTPEHPTGWDPVRTHIGRAYNLQVFRCAGGFDCPPIVRMT